MDRTCQHWERSTIAAATFSIYGWPSLPNTPTTDSLYRMGFGHIIAMVAPVVTAAMSSDRKAEPSLPITMTHIPPDTCTMTVSGQSFALPKDDAAATATLQDLRRTWTSASIGSAVDIPYRCTAAILFIAQRAGFDRIGFVGLPTPKPKTLRPR